VNQTILAATSPRSTMPRPTRPAITAENPVREFGKGTRAVHGITAGPAARLPPTGVTAHGNELRVPGAATRAELVRVLGVSRGLRCKRIDPAFQPGCLRADHVRILDSAGKQRDSLVRGNKGDAELPSVRAPSP
jgi:hypothetical protein